MASVRGALSLYCTPSGCGVSQWSRSVGRFDSGMFTSGRCGSNLIRRVHRHGSGVCTPGSFSSGNRVPPTDANAGSFGWGVWQTKSWCDFSEDTKIVGYTYSRAPMPNRHFLLDQNCVQQHRPSTGCRCHSTQTAKNDTNNDICPEIILYQFEVCPFCCGVKGVMDTFRLPYKAVETNPVNKRQIKESPFLTDTTYLKVPVAVINGKQVNGSMDIINELAGMKIRAGLESLDKNNKELMEAVNWIYSKYVILFPSNIYRTLYESWEAFHFVSDCMHFITPLKPFLRFGGALFMYYKKKKGMHKYGITDARQSIYAATDEWMKKIHSHANKTTKFHGGDTPDVADAVMYGQLSSMKKMQTLRDLKKENPVFAEWFEEMETFSSGSMRTKQT